MGTIFLVTWLSFCVIVLRWIIFHSWVWILFIAGCEQTLSWGLVNTSTEVWARLRSCKLLWSKIPGVNSNINDTPRSPWYKTKWSHLLSSGMQLQAMKAFHILKMANHKRDLERVLWRSRQSFLWRVLFSICEKLSLLAVASHYSINGSISFCTRDFGECH